MESRFSRCSNARSASSTCCRPISNAKVVISCVGTADRNSNAVPLAGDPLVSLLLPLSILLLPSSASVRNLGLEKIANTVKFPCKFASSGCPLYFHHYEKVEHEEICECRSVLLPNKETMENLADPTAVRVRELRASGRAPSTTS